MKRPLLALAWRYRAALKGHLQRESNVPEKARALGKEAAALGLDTLDIARIHKAAWSALQRSHVPVGDRNRRAKRARLFYSVAVTPVRRTERKSAGQLRQQGGMFTERTARLTAANRHLKHALVEHKSAEEALRRSGRRSAKLLRDSRHLQKDLRRLAHRLLSAQEAERKKISRELHDEVGQTLLGINVRLFSLKKAARGSTPNTTRLAKEIASTRRLVEDSVQSINRFARELGRPAPAAKPAGRHTTSQWSAAGHPAAATAGHRRE